MSPGAALWLSIAFLAYCALGRVRERSVRMALALLWPLGLVYLVLSSVGDDIRRMVNRL